MKTGGRFLITPIGSEEIFTRESFSEDHLAIQDLGKTFANEQIKPNREKIEKYDKELTLKLMKESANLDLLGIHVSEEYGGFNLGIVAFSALLEELAQGGSASFVTTITAHMGIGTLPIEFFGTEKQKQKYIPKLIRGELLSAFALTEPEYGTDALSASTTAILSEDKKYYIFNGTKQFITNGNWANVFTLFAEIDGEKFTAFIVDGDTEGLSRGPEEEKMGLHGSSTCSILLENAKVPVENVLGKIGKGHQIALNILDVGRMELGAADLGGCKYCINEAVLYASQRKQFGQPIAKFDAIRSKFAEMVSRTFCLESIVYRTSGMLDETFSELEQSDPQYYEKVVNAMEQHAIESSIVKIYGSEALWRVVDHGVQIYGGYGFSEEYPLAAVARDNRVDRIFEGTNEINRQLIIGFLTKKSFLEELPIRDAIKTIQPILDGNLPEIKSDILVDEKRALEVAKAAMLYVFNETICRYGQGIRQEQQMGEMLADGLMGLYVVDSALNRITQNEQKGNGDAIWLKLGQLITAETMYDLTSNIRRAVCNLFSGDELEKSFKELDIMFKHMLLSADIFLLKREIADDLYEHGHYRF